VSTNNQNNQRSRSLNNYFDPNSMDVSDSTSVASPCIYTLD